MATLASVKIEREKMLELLREAKEEKLAKFDERMQAFNEKLASKREQAVETAKGDLTEDENLKSLHEALSIYFTQRRERFQYIDGIYVNMNERKNIEQRYDSALKLVEISSDEFFKVTANTEFGVLLGL